MIEQLAFRRRGVWYVRAFTGLVTFLVAPSKSGKSTAIEALLYPLGLSTARVMPVVRECEELRLVFRVAGTRWQATRSGSQPRARVTVKNLDAPNEPPRSLPVTSSRAGEMTAGVFLQDLLGLPAAARGKTQVGLDKFYSTVLALRQNTIASEFLGGATDEQRALVLEAVLGLWNADLAGLEKNASETKSRHGAAKALLSQMKKMQKNGTLPDPEAIGAEYAQKQREHGAAAQRAREAGGVLREAIGECGRLAALHKSAEAERKKAVKRAEAARGKLHQAAAAHARAEGELTGLLRPAAQTCSRCEQRLPEREPGLCQQCAQPHYGVENRWEQKVAAARAKVEQSRHKLPGLEEAAAAAAQAAEAAEGAATQALAARDACDRDQVLPARQATQLTEKEAHGLSRDVERLAQQWKQADYLRTQTEVIEAAKAQMEEAKAARDAAVAEQEVRRKEVVGRWEEFFLARLQQINPAVEAARIDPKDFTTRVKAREAKYETFEDSSVGGSPRVVTNVALLLALRDLGRVDGRVRIPPLLIIDSPLSGLGAQGVDHETGLRLIDTLISVAEAPSVDGYACQVIAATNDPLPRPYPGVREIFLSDDQRFFDHAPALAS